jgi:hypothetical protein
MRQAKGLGGILRGAFAIRGASPPAKGSSAPTSATGSASPRILIAFASALIALALALPALASAAPPTLTINPATGVTATTAQVSGEVNPEGASTTWKFQYISAEAFDENLEHSLPGFQGATTGPTDTTETTEPLSGELTGLDPATRYHLRLFAQSSGGSAEAVAATFKTPGAAPLVKAWAAGPIAPTTADLNAQVDPQGSATVYWFEWGPADCSANPCASIPAEHDASAGAGRIYVYVLRHLSGLSPETTYHFRLLAENSVGTTEGPDQTFTTAAPEPACTNAGLPGTAFLPDCRAYEMVSPPAKDGADVIASSYKTFAAEVGDAVSFPATAPFGQVQGSSTDVQYLSRRDGAAGTNGWRTHAINPPGSAPTFQAIALNSVPTFEAVFTPDLTRAVYKSLAPLTDAPNVAEVPNLYRLGDLDAGESPPQLLSPSASPLVLPSFLDPVFKLFLTNSFDGASRDLSHVIFQSPWNLTGDGSFTGFEGGNLYEYADGAGLRAVGRIPSGPDTSCDDLAGPPCEAAPSSRAGISVSLTFVNSQYSTGMISADGSRILFTTPETGAIYLREDGTRTYQLASNGQLWAMSADGSRVFFTTGADLYMYEVEKPEGSRLTLLSETNGGADVVGASADGHYLYFIASPQLVPGEPSPADLGLYRWHDGDIAYIGQFPTGEERTLNSPLARWDLSSLTKTSRVTPDGRSLLFSANSDKGFRGRGGFAGYAHETHREIYLYSADTGRLVCVSCNPTGDPATGDALVDLRAGSSGSVPTQHLSHALSADGRHVFFSTPDSLLPEDTNGYFDAYEYDVPTATLHLISTGTDSADSYYLDSSPDGSDVYFATRQRLVGWDVDRSYDLYDARVEGGFPEPRPVPAACEGESCLPATQAAPGAPPSASQAAGPGNPHRCPKGTRPLRRHGKTRCAKKKAGQRKHKRATNDNRRTGR